MPVFLKKLPYKIREFLFRNGLKTVRFGEADRRILVYHGVTANANTGINSRFISSKLFEQQLSFFKEHFHLVSLKGYINGDRHDSKLTLTITFDDGYLNNLNEALPILEKYAVPATFYITTIQHSGFDYLWADLIDLYRYTGPNSLRFNHIEYRKGKHEYVSSDGTFKALLKNSGWELKEEISKLILQNNNFINDQRFSPYFKLMNSAQIRQLAKSPLVTIGSHGLYHNCLSKVSLQEAEEELALSKSYLENIIQKEVSSFAYPDGSYNHSLLDLTEKIGYTSQLLVDYNDPEDKNDPRVFNRFGINPYISFNHQMQCIINGHY